VLGLEVGDSDVEHIFVRKVLLKFEHFYIEETVHLIELKLADPLVE